MFEGVYERLPDSDAYLRRIGMEGQPTEVSVACLNRLICANITHIPFENIDVWDTGICPDIGTVPVFNKVVRRNRGGYCFEINGLFHAFLQELGFETYNVAVRIMVGYDEITPCTHRALVTVIDGKKYFCDIGFGTAACRGSVPIDGPETADGFSAEEKDGVCAIYQRLQGEKKLLMMFNDFPFEPADYIPINFYDSQRPDYPFRINLSVSITTPSGRKQLFNYRLKELDMQGNVIKVTDAKNTDELSAMLLEHFGINYRFTLTRDKV